MSATVSADPFTSELELDPFAYQPGKASGIAGLGTGDTHEDPGYAFHTDYVYASEGQCCFTVRFQGLTAKSGTLQLRVHMFLDGDRPQLVLGNSSRTQFNRLIQLGSEANIFFDGFKRVRYALYGNILGASDARADGITVTLNRPGSADDNHEARAELRNSEFGREATRPMAIMVSTDPPTLASPVCQAATVEQAREPAYAGHSSGLAPDLRGDGAGWIAAYVAQSLSAYGVLQAGARGVGFGLGAEAIADAIRTSEIEVALGDLPRSSELLPGLLVNYDFLWSTGALGRDGVDHAFAYGEALMKCLRPGGLAVHIVPFIPGYDQRQSGSGTSVFLRADIERLALQMIARNFETAQLKIACDEALSLDWAGSVGIAGAFGLLFRKPPISGI